MVWPKRNAHRNVGRVLSNATSVGEDYMTAASHEAHSPYSIAYSSSESKLKLFEPHTVWFIPNVLLNCFFCLPGKRMTSYTSIFNDRLHAQRTYAIYATAFGRKFILYISSIEHRPTLFLWLIRSNRRQTKIIAVEWNFLCRFQFRLKERNE